MAKKQKWEDVKRDAGMGVVPETLFAACAWR